MAASIEYFLCADRAGEGLDRSETAVFAHVVLMHLRERVRALLDAGCAGRDDERRYKRYAQWGQLGEIAEQWVNRDELGMLIELGVVASADKSK